MEQVEVKIKLLEQHAFVPRYAKEGDAGMDLMACSGGTYDPDNDYIEYGTGIALEIPKGYVGLIFPRSSISKTPHSLCNAVGVIDSSYRGEVICRFRTNPDREHMEYRVGDRIAQLMIMPYPQVSFKQVEDLSDTDRGEGGFGSSGT